MHPGVLAVGLRTGAAGDRFAKDGQHRVISIDGELKSLLSKPDPSRLRRHFIAAIVLAAVLLATTVFALLFMTQQGPTLPAFMSVVATVWAAAEIITAVLLFSQFAVTGLVPFAVFAGAFGVAGLLTIPYLLFFPKVFLMSSTIGMLQVSVWMWLFWHLAFALAGTAYRFFDRDFQLRILDPGRVSLVLRSSIAPPGGPGAPELTPWRALRTRA